MVSTFLLDDPDVLLPDPSALAPLMRQWTGPVQMHEGPLFFFSWSAVVCLNVALPCSQVFLALSLENLL